MNATNLHAPSAPHAFQHDVAASRGYLLRFARQQLRNDAWADDVVAETMLAALEKPQNFHGRSSLNTWLVGILKFKIIDCLRAHSREIASSGPAFDDDADADSLAFADQRMAEEPSALPSPEVTMQSYEFLAQVDRCLEQMPSNMSRVFYLGEWMGYSTDEICAELKITPSNAWVLLHRARGRLREYLRETLSVSASAAH